jgi:hypothetical protein
MKTIFLHTAVPILFLCSCQDQVCEPDILTTTYSDSTDIQMVFDSTLEEIVYNIMEGESLVFQHIFYNGHCDGNGDDDYTKTIGFELPAHLTEFVLRDSALVKADCFVHSSSVWLNNYYPISSGILEGKKLEDDEWIIRGSLKYTIPLTFPQHELITFYKVFRP